MKKGFGGKLFVSKVFLFIMLFVLILNVFAYPVLASNDVAYIYKNKAAVDKNVVKVFEDMGLKVKLISEKNIPDLSDYKFIYVGDERFKYLNNIKIWKYPSIISNYFYGNEFGITDNDGVSKLAANSPLSVRAGSEIIQVYTKAKFGNGVSIPYYYLAEESKTEGMIKTASPYTNNGEFIGDVISYGDAGIILENGKIAQKSICFFGIVESNYWTDEAVDLFKECVEHVGVLCNSDTSCQDKPIGTPYCVDNKIYQKINDFSCVNPGTVLSECIGNEISSLIKICSNSCENGMCVCLDKDGDNYDECNSTGDGDDGKIIDCNDNNIIVYPGAVEICKDNLDNNCNGIVDENCSRDRDGDGYDDINPGSPGDDGKPADCNDNDSSVYPGAFEICDGKDNDCDGVIDESNGDCGSGHICSLGVCTAVTCTKSSDCGVDGFFDGLFCSNNDVYQNFITYKCENPGTISSSCSNKVENKIVTNCSNSCQNGMCVDITCDDNNDCSDNNSYTKDSCVNPGTVSSYCSYENIKCLSNTDCNDNDQSTIDKCVSPGNVNSYCSYEDIVCSNNADCGIDGFFDGLFCSSNDVYQNFITYKCENPGTISSSCSQNIEPKKVNQCTDTCSDGTCVDILCKNNNDCNDQNPNTNDICVNPGQVNSQCTHEGILCMNNNECGTDRYTGNLFCQGNDIYRNFLSFSCNSPGSVNSFCNNNLEAKKLFSCTYACNNGNCLRCNDNNDCNDENTNTVDSCRFGGTIDSFCSYEVVSCFNDESCGQDGFVGVPFCSNENVYQNFKDLSCMNPGNPGSFCNSNINAQLIESCLYGCDNGACKNPVSKCSDEVDNDNDGKIDYPSDRGCLNVDDNNEFGEPFGYLDGVQNCNTVYGWACDLDNFNEVVDVHLYNDGPVGAGGNLLSIVEANIQREVQVGLQCGGNSIHGFSFALPDSLKDDKSHSIYAYAINIGTPSNNAELQNIPLYFTCGLSICKDNDSDGFDKCNPGNTGDDGKQIDCNDNDSSVYPGAFEICDGKDNDCDGVVDESTLAPSFMFNEEWEIRDYINSLHKFTFLPDGEHDASSIKYDQVSANKVCELKGYSNADIKKVSSYVSCFDNNHAYWDSLSNDFKYFNACLYNLHIEKLLCSNPISCI